MKLVYCLGYGIPYLLDNPEKIANNPGTKQYDRLFSMCAGLDENPVRVSRLGWKAKVLTTLKAQGFWLLDASCHACYLGKNERLPSEIVSRIVPISWKKYVKPIIEEALTDWKRVWIVGKGLRDLLSSQDQTVPSLNWIYQPNVRFSNPERYREKETREQHLRKAIEQCCLGKHGKPTDLTADYAMEQRTQRHITSACPSQKPEKARERRRRPQRKSARN